MTSFDQSHCARCLRVPRPGDIGYRPGDDTSPVDWEVVTDSAGEVTGVICPECVTPGERQGMDEDAMDLGGEEGQ